MRNRLAHRHEDTLDECLSITLTGPGQRESTGEIGMTGVHGPQTCSETFQALVVQSDHAVVGSIIGLQVRTRDSM